MGRDTNSAFAAQFHTNKGLIEAFDDFLSADIDKQRFAADILIKHFAILESSNVSNADLNNTLVSRFTFANWL